MCTSLKRSLVNSLFVDSARVVRNVHRYTKCVGVVLCYSFFLLRTMSLRRNKDGAPRQWKVPQRELVQ